MLKRAITAFAAGMALGVTLASPVLAADAPSEIKLGTLYASSGRYAFELDAGPCRVETLG